MLQAIEQAVRSKYGSVATSGLSTDHEGVRAVAEAFGYSAINSTPSRRKPTWGYRAGTQQRSLA